MDKIGMLYNCWMLSDKIDSLLYSFVMLYALALTRLNIEPLCIVHQYRRVVMFDKLLKLTQKKSQFYVVINNGFYYQ